MVVPALSLPPALALVEHLLHPLKQLVVNQRLMPARANLALVGDEAEVVRVSQHRCQLGDGHRPAGLPSGPGPEPSPGQFLFQGFQ